MPNRGLIIPQPHERGLMTPTQPQDSPTAPIWDQFAWVSLTILDFFYAIAKAKKLSCKSIAQNLKQDSLTRRLFRFTNGG